MYKVFIDHKPILFVNESEISPKLISVTFEKFNNFSADISVYLKEVTLNFPLQIICLDASESFVASFSDHHLVEAAGGVVRKGHNLLMIFRNGLWDIPKGKLNQNESPQVGAIREVEEECGITKPTILKFLCATYHTYLYEGQKTIKKTSWFVMDYKGTDKLNPQRDEGITNVKWCTLQEFNNVRGNTYGSINEVIDQYSSFLKKEEDMIS